MKMPKQIKKKAEKKEFKCPQCGKVKRFMLFYDLKLGCLSLLDDFVCVCVYELGLFVWLYVLFY